MGRDLRPVRKVLDTLRRKVRSAWATRGGSFLVAAVCGALVVSFALDYGLDMPRTVRMVHLGLVVLGLFLFARVVLLRPLAVDLPEHDLVQAIEQGVPEMRDRLVSALDFEKRLDDPAEVESREMMGRVVDEAVGLAAGLDPSRLVDPVPARRARNLALACAGVLVAVAIGFPSAFGLWVQRGLLLADLDWPRRTTLTVLEFPDDGTLVITRGDDLRVIAFAEGVRPRQVQLHYEELGEAAAGTDEEGEDGDEVVLARDVRKMFPTEEADGHYATVFPSVSSSFRFWVTGGDDTDRKPVYEVRALVPPRISSIRTEVTYPEYTGLPAVTSDEPQVEVLSGSHVAFTLRSNMPLAAARLLPADGPSRDLETGADGQEIRLEFDVDEDVEFHLELEGEEGQKNRPENDLFHVRTIEDRPPQLRVLYPLERLYRTPIGIVPLKTRVDDDFGVAGLRAELIIGTHPVESLELWPEDGPSATLQERVDDYRAIDLQEYQGDAGALAKAGDVVKLLVVATDNLGKEREAPEIVIEVLTAEDLQRRMHQRQIGLREELAQLRRGQRRALGGLRALRDDVKGRTPDAAALDRGRDLQVDQGRVGNQLRQFLGGIHRVFDGYVLNRMGSLPTVDRLLPIYHSALAQPADNSAEVFRPDLYRRILAEKRAGRIYDPEVLGILLEIMDLGDVAFTQLSPAVFDALGAWGDGKDHEPARLDEAVAKAEELGLKLAELERRMERWEDFNEFIERLRELRIMQEELARPLKGDEDGSDK